MGDPSLTVVRKASYGRTSLFLPTKGVMFKEVRCMGGVTKTETASLYHACSPLHSLSTEVACWHCAETIPSGQEKIPIPKVYDKSENNYHVHGATCSPECAKAYVVEHSSFDRPHQLHILKRMLMEVYGYTEHVVEAPPRQALVRFGGVMSVAPRANRTCRLVEPPFVSYCMLMEERSSCRGGGGGATSSLSSLMERVGIDGLGTGGEIFDEAEEVPGLFSDYAARRRLDTEERKRSKMEVEETRGGKEASEWTGKRTRPEPAPKKVDPRGPLAKFVKKNGSATSGLYQDQRHRPSNSSSSNGQDDEGGDFAPWPRSSDPQAGDE